MTTVLVTGAGVHRCSECGAELPLSFLACPGCGRIVHAEKLRALASEGQAAEREGDDARALAAWRRALELLPMGAGQYATILAKIQALSARVPAGASNDSTTSALVRSAPAARAGKGKWVAGLGGLGLVLAKFKWAIFFLLAKGKVLLLGLTQGKTFITMAIAVGVYTLAFGWWFAFGLVISIYVHEMGHVVWLRRYGIAATAPMFIPGLGAFVRLKQYPATVAEDARVGLAGPIWGAAAAIIALVAGHVFGSQVLLAIARVGAWINLFNLLPVWQLDGARGFSALSRRQRGLVAAVLCALALTTADGVLILLAIAAAVRAAAPRGAPEKGDRAVLATYLALSVGLTLLMAGGPKP